MTQKIVSLCAILTLCSSCSEFALIASGGSVVVSHNVYAKAYSGTDILTIMHTEKDIKTHTYERIKKIIDERD